MWKTSTALQEAPVCLRCQYRLALRRRRPQLIPQRSHVQQPRQHRHFALGRPLYQDTATAPEDDNDPALGTTIFSWEIPKKPVKRIDRSRGTFTSTKDSLGFDTLGEPAEVLIIKEREAQDGGEHSRSSLTSPNPASHDLPPERADVDQPPIPPTSSKDILDEMDAERGIVDMEQVFENIEAVKSGLRKDKTLPWESIAGTVRAKDYGTVAGRLTKGFTWHQLAAYYREKVKGQDLDPFELHHVFGNQLYARSSWKAGTSELWRIRAPMILEVDNYAGLKREAPALKSFATKEAIVFEIMTRGWRVRPLEEASYQGEMDIRLKPSHIALIINHSMQHGHP